jgi:oligopeptidase A
MSAHPVFSLPVFFTIKPETIEQQVSEAIANCKSVITDCLKQPQYSWQNLIVPIEEADDKLGKLWSPISHTNSVLSSDALREAHDKCLPSLTEYGTWVKQHGELYTAYAALAESPEFATLSTSQQKVINNALRDFKLSGVALPNDKKQRYSEISHRLSIMSSQFSNNLMDATHGWVKQVENESELSGLPESALAAAKQAAEAKQLSGWLFANSSHKCNAHLRSLT